MRTPVRFGDGCRIVIALPEADWRAHSGELRHPVSRTPHIQRGEGGSDPTARPQIGGDCRRTNRPWRTSAGAACSSGKVQPSNVLAAMGADPLLARGAIRISLGPATLESEVDRFLDAWTKLLRGLHKGLEGTGGLAA